MSHQRHKAFNYVSFLFLLLFAVGAWAVYAFVPAYYSTAEIGSVAQSGIFKKWRQGPQAVREQIILEMNQQKNIRFEPETNLEVINEEGSPVFDVKLQYVYLVSIPFSEDDIEIPFEVNTQKDLTLQNSLQ